MNFSVQALRKSYQPSPVFRLLIVVILLGAGLGFGQKFGRRWIKAQSDAHKANTTVLTASDSEHRQLLNMIRSHQAPGETLEIKAQDLSLPERIFQASLSPELLGRNSQYEPYTHNGVLACAWMVNKVMDQALGYKLGRNQLFVPSVVKDLDSGTGRQILQDKTLRGDIAIANGTDYQEGQWHIGICVNDGCSLVLSNSPSQRRFSWLSDANFDGSFSQYPGETTFYRLTKARVPQN